jgi:hypothetical protein
MNPPAIPLAEDRCVSGGSAIGTSLADLADQGVGREFHFADCSQPMSSAKREGEEPSSSWSIARRNQITFVPSSLEGAAVRMRQLDGPAGIGPDYPRPQAQVIL